MPKRSNRRTTSLHDSPRLRAPPQVLYAELKALQERNRDLETLHDLTSTRTIFFLLNRPLFLLWFEGYFFLTSYCPPFFYMTQNFGKFRTLAITSTTCDSFDLRENPNFSWYI